MPAQSGGRLIGMAEHRPECCHLQCCKDLLFRLHTLCTVLGVCAKYNPQNFLDGFVPMNIIVGPNEKTLYSGTNDSSHSGNLIISKECETPRSACEVLRVCELRFHP